MVHHVHRELFIGEFGVAGYLLYWLVEKLPLSTLYRRTPFVTISNSARQDLTRDGIPYDHITVEYLGVDPHTHHRGTRADGPRIIFVGRLKAYKRVEVLLDVLEAIPEATLDVVGEGDHRPDLEREIARRGLSGRVVMHGYVDQERKAELYGRAWLNMVASQSEGWSLTVMEAAMCGTPSVALAVGGLPESVVHGETGLLAHDTPELIRQARRLIDDDGLRERMGDAAEGRAATFTWDRSAASYLQVMRRAAGLPAREPAAQRVAGETARADGPNGGNAGRATATADDLSA
jgi:glycosyltransferase involved in cell wall biosynthesis